MLMLLWGFLLFLLCGESEPPRLQTSSANQIWRAIQPVDVWWSRDYPAAVSITSLKRKYAIGARIKNLSFVLVHGTKANIFFVLLLACVLRNLSDTWSFKVPRRRLYAIIRHPRGQSDVARQWTLVFVSSKIPHCSRSWSVVLLFIVST